MSTDPRPSFKATMDMVGPGAREISISGVPLAHLVREVDIHLRAGEQPTVVIRPKVDDLTVNLEPGTAGGSPRFLLAPDVAHVLEETLGWASPAAVEALKSRIATLEAERLYIGETLADHQHARDDMGVKLVGVERERDTLAARVSDLERELADEQQRYGSLAEELSDARGRIADLELAERTEDTTAGT